MSYDSESTVTVIEINSATESVFFHEDIFDRFHFLYVRQCSVKRAEGYKGSD